MLRIICSLVLVAWVTAQYTPKGDIFSANDFEDWVNKQIASNQRNLKVTPGTYYVPTNTTYGSYNIYLNDVNNVALNMDGVVLLFEDCTKGGFGFGGDCHDVAVHGLTINYMVPCPTQATIDAISADGKTFDITIHEGYSLSDWIGASRGGGVPTGYIFDTKTYWWKHRSDDLYGSKVQALGGRKFRIFYSSDNGPNVQNVAVGDFMAFRSVYGGFGFALFGCGNMSVSNILIHSSGSFGYFDGGGYGNNSFTNCDIRRGPLPRNATYSPLLSTTADGLHSANTRHGPIISNCYFEGMPDDGIAVHGKYSLVTAASGRSLIITLIDTDYTPGDTLRLYDNNYIPQGNFTLVSITPLKSYTPPHPTSHTEPVFNFSATSYATIVVDRPVPSAAGFDWLISNVDAEGLGYILHNNTIYQHRARGMLLKASNGHVFDNIIDGSSMAGIAIFPELYWNEADYSHNLLVCGNTVRNVAYHSWPVGGILVTAVDPDNHATRGYGHVNVALVGNWIENVNFTNLVITSGKNISLRDNQIMNPFQQQPWGSNSIYDISAVAWLSEVEIEITGNCISSIGKFATNITQYSLDVVANVPSGAAFKECVNRPPSCSDIAGKHVIARLYQRL